MKILFVATVDIHIINHHLRIIHKLHEMGHRVDVASCGEYTNLDITNKFNVPFSKNPFSLDNRKAAEMVEEIVVKNGYDIVSCHTPLSSYYTRMQLQDLPVKVLYMAHGFHFYKGCPLVNRLIYKTLEKRAARYTDTLITINQEDYEAACQFQLKEDGEVKLIPGVGIDLEKIQSRKKDPKQVKESLGLQEDSILCMTVGELNKNKNQLFVLEQLKEDFHSNPNLHFVLCGVGPYEEKLRTWIHQEQLEDQIHILGYCDDVLSILSGADYFFSPSFREGLPVSVMEAMAMQVPVLASNVRGNHDLIQDHKNGLLFELRDATGVKEAFHLLQKEENLKKQLVQQAYQDVQQYDLHVIDPQLLELYKR